MFVVSQHRELSSVLRDDLKGWDGEMGGRLKRKEVCVYLWLIHRLLYSRR